MSLTSLLVRTYSLTSRTGIFELPIVKKPFSWAYFLYKRHIEDPFFFLLKKYPSLLGSGVLIDIGANIGYTSLLFAEFSSASQPIHAFEPEPANFHELVRIINVKRLQQRIQPHCIALGETQKTCSFWHANTHHADHRVATSSFEKNRLGSSNQESNEFIQVEMTSLDDFATREGIREQISFVKMDVQGYEIEVLKGMEGLAENASDLTLAIEYCPRDLHSLGYEPEELLSKIESLGFDIYMYHAAELRRLERDLLSEIVASRGYSDLICFLGSARERVLGS